MAENEKDVPLTEREDGSILAKIELPENLEVIEGNEEDKDSKKKKKDKKAEKEEAHDDEEDAEDEAEDDEAAEDGETDEERERIREARREERRLKKDLKRQREISAKNKITALERRNAELAERLAKVENTASSYQFAQLDKAIEDEATRVEYAKMKMLEAARNNDAAAQVEYLEQLTDAKQRFKQAQHYKKQQLELLRHQNKTFQIRVTTEVQQNAKLAEKERLVRSTSQRYR